MDTARLQRRSENQWWIAPHGKMRVPAVIFASNSGSRIPVAAAISEKLGLELPEPLN